MKHTKTITASKWAAVGAAVAVTLGAGGLQYSQAAVSTGEMPVYIPLDEPCRVADTRPAAGPIGPKGTPIGAGEAEAYEIQITGDSGNCTGALAVPADAVAVSTNMTAIAPTATSFFTAYPGDAALPLTSNVNFVGGQAPTPNKVDVGLSATGTIKIYNDAGTAHAAVDIFGYYVDHEHTGDDIVDGSLTKVDIRDEAGLVHSYDDSDEDGPLTGGGTVDRVAADVIRLPADGHVIVQASGIFSALSAGTDNATCQITQGAKPGALNTGAEPWTNMTDFGSAVNSVQGFSTHRVFDVEQADNGILVNGGAVFGLDCVEVVGNTEINDVVFSITYVSTERTPAEVSFEL